MSKSKTLVNLLSFRSGIGIVVVGLAIKAIPDAMAGFGLTHDDLPSIIPEDVVSYSHLNHS